MSAFPSAMKAQYDEAALGGQSAVEALCEVDESYGVADDVFDAITKASIHGSAAAVRVLVEAGVTIHPNYRFYAESPLVNAVFRGHIEVVRVLIEAGEDANGHYGMDGLIYHSFDDAMAMYLLDHGARPDLSLMVRTEFFETTRAMILRGCPFDPILFNTRTISFPMSRMLLEIVPMFGFDTVNVVVLSARKEHDAIMFAISRWMIRDIARLVCSMRWHS